MKLNYATLALILVALAFFLVHTLQFPWTGIRIAGLAIAIPSFLLLVLARIQLGRAFSAQARATILVTTGLYSRIRNPIYIFSALLLIGIVLLAARPLWLLCLAILVPLQIFRSRREARVLEEKFGDAYLEYKQKTWF
jgi:protein-S-isoprenylcysteine O-methyltransferase Ste14